MGPPRMLVMGRAAVVGGLMFHTMLRRCQSRATFEFTNVGHFAVDFRYLCLLPTPVLAPTHRRAVSAQDSSGTYALALRVLPRYCAAYGMSTLFQCRSPRPHHWRSARRHGRAGEGTAEP